MIGGVDSLPPSDATVASPVTPRGWRTVRAKAT